MRLRSGLFSIVFVCLLLSSAAAEQSAVVTSEEILIEQFLNEFELDTSDYKIEILKHNLNLADIEHRQLTVHPITQKELLGLYTVIVKVLDNGEVIGQSQVRMRISKFATVLVAADRISGRTALTGDMVRIQRMDITTLREKPLTNHLELAGYRAKRNLPRGKIITTASIEAVPDVERGRDVKILITAGGCRISAEGVALQKGLSGEYIKVRNKSSGKIILARVTGQSAVAVDP